MTLYYDRARDSDLLDGPNLLLYRRRRFKERHGGLSLGDIFTTGLPQEDVGRYHSS